MSFNYDLTTLIDYFIGAFTCAFLILLNGLILLKKNIKDIKIYRFLLLIPISIIIIIYSTKIDNILKIIASLITFYMILKLIIKEKSATCLIYCIVTYIIFIIGETLLALLIYISNSWFNINSLFLLSKSIVANFFIGGFGCIISYFLRNKINLYVSKLSESKKLIVLLQAVVLIFVSIALINYLYINNWKFSYEYVLSVIIIFGLFFLMQSLLKQYLDNKEIVDKYSLLEEYMKTSASLIEKYSSTVHKYKNNLIAAKGYYKISQKDGDNYIDNLLESNKTKKYNWFSKINYIPFDSIRYLIYYKLSKAEEINLKIYVNVDKQISKLSRSLINVNYSGVILEILGEYFDNALYACNESKKKELNFNIYLNDNILTLEIANTFLNNVDLNSIYKNGYTTKGKGHGLGLYEVEKSIKNNMFLNSDVKIDKGYFINKLIIDLNFFNKKNTK